MARIKRLWLLTVTATENYAGTHAQLRLEIASDNGEKVWDDLGDPRQNDRERGQTGRRRDQALECKPRLEFVVRPRIEAGVCLAPMVLSSIAPVCSA